AVLVALLFVLLALVQRIDRTPYTETAHYKAWKDQSWDLPLESGGCRVGWALQNITPPEPVPLAGYGKRRGRHYESVHDSVYVRSVALQTGTGRVFFVSADLLFIPPKVVEAVEEKLKGRAIGLKDIHFSATHSHSSIGGWESTLTGELFGGKYDPAVVELLAERFCTAILASAADLSEGKVSYSEVVDDEDVRYRINLPGGVRDREIRALSFTKASGEKAYLITYSAHNTTLGDGNLQLSRDYSGVLVDSLQPAFALYMAGAVAGMGPVERGATEFEEAQNQGLGVLRHFKQRKEVLLGDTLTSALIRVPLPGPTARLTRNLALRPWVFRRFFGDYEAYIKVTRVGNTLLLACRPIFRARSWWNWMNMPAKGDLILLLPVLTGGM
ncbi:MAG: neutral/alkaline non-lysosomal ceramidase N-terminal domain-containing protein, partial [Leadbetterella sp.]|nr:neutral/alkaline non-lysosomal ceramidase N-terminal domain-containing protein [Leadbetterella sp.]